MKFLKNASANILCHNNIHLFRTRNVNTLKADTNGWHIAGNVFICILGKVMSKLWFKYADEVCHSGLMWQYVNIFLGNGLMPDGTKPLFKHMMTQFIYEYMPHQASIS